MTNILSIFFLFPLKFLNILLVLLSHSFFFLKKLFIFGCAGSSVQNGLLSSCSARASHCSGFSCCGAQALGCEGFRGCGAWAPQWLSSKESACSTGDTQDADSIPGSGRPPRGGNGNPLQCLSLKNPTHRRGWLATTPGVSESWTQRKLLSSRSTGSAVLAPGLQSTGSMVATHGLSCSDTCGIFLDRGSNLCLLHWQVD